MKLNDGGSQHSIDFASIRRDVLSRNQNYIDKRRIVLNDDTVGGLAGAAIHLEAEDSV